MSTIMKKNSAERAINGLGLLDDMLQKFTEVWRPLMRSIGEATRLADQDPALDTLDKVALRGLEWHLRTFLDERYRELDDAAKRPSQEKD